MILMPSWKVYPQNGSHEVATTSTSDIYKFIDWFQSYKVPVIRNSMIKGVREECGLGSPPATFTTNASESANYMLKHKVNYKQNKLPEFLEKYKELVCEQEQEVNKALLGRGKYKLCNEYQSWHVPESKWFPMTTSQREQHIQKFSVASIMDTFQSEGNAHSICVGRDQSLLSSLSVDFRSLTDCTRVPLNCLQGIWNKAAELLKTDNAIVAAPGNDNGAKFVLGYRGSKPHLVTPKKTGMFACDLECPNWKALGICAHSVAVAEMSGKLPVFIERIKKHNKTPSISKFAEATMPKGMGKKGDETSRKCKEPSVIETRVQNSYIEGSQDAWPVTISQSNSIQMSPVYGLCYYNSLAPMMQPTGWGYGHNPYAPGLASTMTTPPNAPASTMTMPPTPFTLCKISGNISVCTGCHNKYSKSAMAPDDMCIRHQEWQEYRASGSPIPQSRFGNVYYHFNVQCVWLRCPWFDPSQLEISPDVTLEVSTRTGC